MSKGFLSRQVVFVLMIGMVVLCMMLVGACAEGNGTGTQATPTIVAMDASWHIRYADVKSAKQDPDLNVILSGTVLSLKPAQMSNGIVTTDAVFHVTHIAWNPQKLSIGSTILVRTPGGTIGNTRYEIDDFPMYRVGEQDILFLHVDQRTGLAGTLGGPSGRLLVQNGIVKPLNTEGMNVPPNTSENAFLASIPSA